VLQTQETALTLVLEEGKVATTDGPYADTKEQLGCILVLEARGTSNAVQLMEASRADIWQHFRDSARRGMHENDEGK
jgi:hypothetical protein